MAINILSKATALGAGSDLWIIPEINRSEWSQKIDWYLNFQVGRALQHQNKPLSPFLHKVLIETEMDSFDLHKESLMHRGSLILVGVNDLLPARYVVAVPDSEDLSLWVSAIANVWQNLHRPSIRVFLPQNLIPESFEKVWIQQENGNAELLLVVAY